MYDETILEFSSEIRAFESYLFFTELIGESNVTLESVGGGKIKEIIKRIKEFFVRIGIAIKNFIMKYLGKSGRLLNVRAMKMITTKIDLWNKQNHELLVRIEKQPKLQDVIDFKERILKESEKLENDVSIAVLNSPKITDFVYYNKQKMDNVLVFHNKCEKMANTILEEQDFDVASEEFNVVLALSDILSIFTNTIMKNIDKATYKSKEENSKIEFEPVEAEIIYRD